MNVIDIAGIASKLSNEDLMVLLVMLKERCIIWDNTECTTCGIKTSIVHEIGDIAMNGSAVQLQVKPVEIECPE